MSAQQLTRMCHPEDRGVRPKHLNRKAAIRHSAQNNLVIPSEARNLLFLRSGRVPQVPVLHLGFFFFTAAPAVSHTQLYV